MQELEEYACQDCKVFSPDDCRCDEVDPQILAWFVRDDVPGALKEAVVYLLEKEL